MVDNDSKFFLQYFVFLESGTWCYSYSLDGNKYGDFKQTFDVKKGLGSEVNCQLHTECNAVAAIPKRVAAIVIFYTLSVVKSLYFVAIIIYAFQAFGQPDGGHRTLVERFCTIVKFVSVRFG